MNRQHAYRFVALTAFVMLVVVLVTMPPAALAQRRARAGGKRPNIIVIVADDLGFSDLGSYGGEIDTPNLDRLAQGGQRYTQFYNSTRCCPTRASLLTGLYPQQTGVGWLVDQPVQPGRYTRRLNDSCVTIAEALRGAGYHTLMSGKWHVGEERGSWPVDRGFEQSFVLLNALSNYFGVFGSYPVNERVTGPMRRIERIERGGIWAVNDKPYTPPNDGSFYSTEAVTNHAVKLVDGHGRRRDPFFLYVAYPAAHWPLHALPEDIAKYRGRYKTGWDAARAKRYERLVKLELVDTRWGLTPRDERVPAWGDAALAEAWPQEMRRYPRSDGLAGWDSATDKEMWDLKMAAFAAQIDRMDQGVGRIFEKLREVGAKDNTLVLFLADNGASAERIDRGVPGAPPGSKESFLSYGLPWANVSNTPFRRYKAQVYEGGIATPLIAHWPSMIKAGSINHQPGHVMDIAATVLDVAGAKYPTRYKGRRITRMEGKSLAPTFGGKQRAPHQEIYWEHEGNRAVRQGQWKLVSGYPGEWELYDMEVDRTEMNNLASKHPEKVKQLAGLYDAWARRAGVAAWDQWMRRR